MPKPPWTTAGLLDYFREVDQTDDRRFAFILGAGASVQSGIPMAGQLVDAWLRELHAREDHERRPLAEWATAERLDIPGFVYARAVESYSQVFARRFEDRPDEGYAYLERILHGRDPSFGYSVLAQVLASTRHRIVITTNFDNLVADALAIYTDKLPFVCGHESLIGFVRSNPRRPLVIKVHRDLLLAPKNRLDELAALPEALVASLRELLRSYTPIVIGYGGNDGSLMGLLRDTLQPGDIPGGIYWCYWAGAGPPGGAIAEVVARHRGRMIPIAGFDELMIELNHRLNYPRMDQRIEQRARERAQQYRHSFEALHRRVFPPPEPPIVGAEDDEVAALLDEVDRREPSFAAPPPPPEPAAAPAAAPPAEPSRRPTRGAEPLGPVLSARSATRGAEPRRTSGTPRADEGLESRAGGTAHAGQARAPEPRADEARGPEPGLPLRADEARGPSRSGSTPRAGEALERDRSDSTPRADEALGAPRSLGVSERGEPSAASASSSTLTRPNDAPASEKSVAQTSPRSPSPPPRPAEVGKIADRDADLDEELELDAIAEPEPYEEARPVVTTDALANSSESLQQAVQSLASDDLGAADWWTLKLHADSLETHERRITAYYAALRQFPDRSELLLGLARTLALANRAGDARQVYRQLERLTPDDPQLHIDLAVLYPHWGARQEAYAHAVRAWQLADPGDRGTRAAVAFVLGLLDRLKHRDDTAALAVLRGLLPVQAPSLVPWLAILGRSVSRLDVPGHGLYRRLLDVLCGLAGPETLGAIDRWNQLAETAPAAGWPAPSPVPTDRS